MPLDIVIILVGALFSLAIIGLTYLTNRHIQPKQLFLLFFTEMWERFSFYGMRALLILYMTNILAYPQKEANLMYGAYNALVYTMPLFGGLLADRILGFRKSIVFGGLLMAIGHLVLAIPMTETFFLGLGFLIVGNGFFKPNISSFLGTYYETNDKRRDGGYAIFYMGVNIGAFLGSALCGYLGQQINWHLGFGLAGIFMILGLIIFLSNQKMLASNGYSPNPSLLNTPALTGISWEKVIYGASLVAVMLSIFLVTHHDVTQIVFMILGIGTIGYILYTSSKEEKQPREMLWAALSMVLFAVVFWGFYEQSGGSLNLMAERNVDMTLFGYKLSSAMVNNSINPFYIILMSPLFAIMWKKLDDMHLKPSDPAKFGLAFLLLAAGYYLFVMGGNVGLGNGSGLMPLGYFAAAYFFITLGELFLSPVGLSMITKLSPARIVGFMMGTWFLASAVGHDLAGYIGSLMAIPEKNVDGTDFTLVQSLGIYIGGCQQIATISLGLGIGGLLVSFIIKKWMHGVR